MRDQDFFALELPDWIYDAMRKRDHQTKFDAFRKCLELRGWSLKAIETLKWTEIDHSELTIRGSEMRLEEAQILRTLNKYRIDRPYVF